jgi:hypothetical protein
MLANLNEPLLPVCDLMFGKPVKYTLPWTVEGQAHQLETRRKDESTGTYSSC